MEDLVIPERLRSTSVAQIGDPARAWLERLPGIIADLAVAWDLEVGPPFRARRELLVGGARPAPHR